MVRQDRGLATSVEASISADCLGTPPGYEFEVAPLDHVGHTVHVVRRHHVGRRAAKQLRRGALRLGEHEQP